MSLKSAKAVRATVALLATLIVLASAAPAFAAPSPAPPAPTSQAGPRIDPDAMAVKQSQLMAASPRVEGLVIIPAQREAVLIQPMGRTWRYFHEVLLHWGGAALLGGVVAVLAVFYLVVGRIRLDAGRSGWRVLRFTSVERFSHWLTAISFVTLALTGLNITFGKIVLMPVIGRDAFGAFAAACKYTHNFVAFAFILGLCLIGSMWIRDNIPSKVDVIWVLQGGGFVGSKRPPAGRFNAGEKLVFWFALGAGLAVAVTGGLLLVPFSVTNIFGMQIAQAIHAVVALVFIAMILGHIYIGTLGMEGAFEAMRTGTVDLNWAQEHHGLWLEEERRKGHEPVPPAQPLGNPAE
jgi:formate dehydrogenase subunit gamma